MQHPFFPRISARASAALAVLLAAAGGRAASPPGAEASETSPAIEPPTLLENAEAEYPQGARALGLEGRVVLVLLVGADGSVQSAEVLEGAGHGFDEAALEAARRLRFVPARHGDHAVASRIRYPYLFRLETSDGTPSTAAPPAPRSEDTAPAPSEPAAGESVVASSSAPATTTHADAAAEVTVSGPSRTERLRRSAEAVTVLETESARRQTADLGEVLARTEGIGVQRGGGLGSSTRLSLAGLSDDQVRVFLDGVPLELTGFPFGIANVPVPFVERIDVHRGVAPIRLAADALGGAVELVSDKKTRGTHAAASYQAGSFDTHRWTLGARHADARSGAFGKAYGFFDVAKNDYAIDVEAPNAEGRLEKTKVHRFHDAYRAGGGGLEVGFVDRPWARRASLAAFVTDHHKDVQNNVVMTVPYGEVTYRKGSAGLTLRYEHALRRDVTVEVVSGLVVVRTDFVDVGTCAYDWYGRCVGALAQPGEIGHRPVDRTLDQHTVYARGSLAWSIADGHTLRATVAPTFTGRTGEDRALETTGGLDPLAAPQSLATLITGLEHDFGNADDRLANILFVKDYLQAARANIADPSGGLRGVSSDIHHVGLGDGARLQLGPSLYAKASYEWAVRLPKENELFGDGVLVLESPELRPETSHNLNASLTFDGTPTSWGAVRAEIQSFGRLTDRLIVLLGTDRVFRYQNVLAARAAGVVGSMSWTSRGELIRLGGNVTWQDFRNTSDDGTFAAFEGDRIPNRPFLFATGTARLRVRELTSPRDELSLTWVSRYVHAFFRSWESIGTETSKQTIPSQLLHALALTYVTRGNEATFSSSLEVQNITDAKAYDFFGVQRPGRAVFGKLTLEL